MLKIKKLASVIKNKEFYVTTINNAIKIISNCDSRIRYICCGYCLVCKELKNISKHICKYMV